MADALLATLDTLPRVGLVERPTPVSALPDLAAELSLSWLGVKRDDLLPALHGGTKVRKLDYLLAVPPLSSARRWVSLGAIGSGHLAALTAAAGALRAELEAHVFWAPPSESTLNNLRFIASGAARLTYHRSSTALALRHPSLLFARNRFGAAVVEPGATNPVGMLGTVRAGLELAVQVMRGELPMPDVVYVPLGSGGTVAGLAVGLAMGGVRPELRAISAVARPIGRAGRVLRLADQVRRYLTRLGVGGAEVRLPIISIDHAQYAPGYGVASAASLTACGRLARWAIWLEPAYSGKAMAALLADPPLGRRVLFWLTPHLGGPLPYAEDWRGRLPAPLARRLEQASSVQRVSADR